MGSDAAGVWLLTPEMWYVEKRAPKEVGGDDYRERR
jgi:hypothetical protein